MAITSTLTATQARAGVPLLQVSTPSLRLRAYEGIVEKRSLAQLRSLAARLRGARVVHINATPDGGGVAEMLRSIVPLSRDLGLNAMWFTLPPDASFFGVTKQMHNWLQGAPGVLTARQQRTYLRYLERLAKQMADLRADVWVIHDPQPLALRALVPLQGAAIWRCHVDCSTPNGCVQEFLAPWIGAYDQALFSMPAYVLPGLSSTQTRIVQPAIDPLSAKNARLSARQVRQTLAHLGIDPDRLLAVQISRFDRWKNPWQVVDAYRSARSAIPGLQLALVGVFAASDDPEGPRIYEAVRKYVGDDPDVHLFRDPALVGAREVNALQSGASVVLQRSTREGFGLTVTEAMWKARPVVATRAGGIPSQIDDEVNGVLAQSTEECAEAMVRLLSHPTEARRLGHAARATVSKRFLLPRLLLDELRAYDDLLNGRTSTQEAA